VLFMKFDLVLNVEMFMIKYHILDFGSE